MTTAAEILPQILTSISTGDLPAIRTLLDKLPLASLSNDQSDMIIACLLDQAEKVKGIMAAREIVTTFDVKRARVNPLPALTNLFLNTYLKRDTLAFVLTCFPYKTELELYVDLINMGDDQAALQAAATMATFFPDLSHDDWDRLYHLTDNVEEEEYENQLLRAYFQTKVSETGSSIPRPRWIRDDIEEKELTSIPNGIPSVKDAVELLLANHKFIDKLNDTTSNMRELLLTQYAIAPTLEKVKMLEKIKSLPTFNDIDIFQELGPVNTMYTDNPSNIDIEHICSKYGGCRMFTCTEFECIDETGDDVDIMAEYPEVTDWFRGSCDICLKKIAKRHYAVREPLLYGGWQGCYCSFTCVEKMLEKKNIKDNCINLMLDSIATQLHTFGIRER